MYYFFKQSFSFKIKISQVFIEISTKQLLLSKHVRLYTENNEKKRDALLIIAQIPEQFRVLRNSFVN